MSTHTTAQLMEWHMQQFRHCLGPTSAPSDNKHDLVPNGFLNFYPQQSSGMEVYATQGYDSGFSSPPLMDLQRSRTFSDMSDFDLSSYHSSPRNALGYFEESMDDLGSVYSDTPSSIISSDCMGQQIDSYGWPTLEIPPRLSIVSSNLSTSPHETQSPQTSVPQSSTTEVDALMQSLAGPSGPSDNEDFHQQGSNGKAKNHYCPIPDCRKAFTQPTHLKIHMRSHTGEKPYVCAIPGCGARFSQLGNRRTHEDRHLGKKPRRRSRAQSDPSETNGAKRYYCKLDGCLHSDHGKGKEFTQLGNLKAHQNKFHKDTLLRLSEHFSRLNSLEYEQTLSREERELVAYFKSLYRNCNKGIKGRGKGRRVEVVI